MKSVRAGVLTIAVAALLAGCTSTGSDTPTSSTSAGSPSVGTASRAPDPVATGTPTLVERSDAAAPSARVAASPADVKSTLTYSDGLTVTLGKGKQGTVTEQGPGALTGLRYTLIPVTVTNGSTRDLNLNNVVPELRYGSPARVAQPIYAEGTIDLHGTLKPKATTSATYAFAVTGAQLSSVSLSLDIDGLHGLAEFSGSLE